MRLRRPRNLSWTGHGEKRRPDVDHGTLLPIGNCEIATRVLSTAPSQFRLAQHVSGSGARRRVNGHGRRPMAAYPNVYRVFRPPAPVFPAGC